MAESWVTVDDVWQHVGAASDLGTDTGWSVRHECCSVLGCWWGCAHVVQLGWLLVLKERHGLAAAGYIVVSLVVPYHVQHLWHSPKTCRLGQDTAAQVLAACADQITMLGASNAHIFANLLVRHRLAEGA